MFTGIVEEKGRVLSCEERAGSWRYRVGVEVVGAGVSLGDSVAVNGCCLTVVEIGEGVLSFDVLEETRRLTNLRDIAVGRSVNLERSLRFDGRVGGHFVSGHIDGVGEIKTLRTEGKDVILEIEIPDGFEKYLVYKGCIAIDGMSLTVAKVEDRLITIWLIPHTLEVTTIGERSEGDSVNLEFDLIAKYTEKIVAQRNA
ncbi:riboflavin synthase [Pelagicoccus sp. SDUM812002]|uniref:riboflavin synthase n=1 Tax=Pelagicoccus sp. SDUM812002 TaxID=3041266 RepID=UPI0028102E3A|nr:riboflavin synthase [Pelagicoccus sp. SDUM812002]MDQ8187355.1 riboflavin synthase [Pelagicoccus sp. SDUM812002]